MYLEAGGFRLLRNTYHEKHVAKIYDKKIKFKISRIDGTVTK